MRNNLAREVPVVGANCLREVTAKLLEKNNLKTNNIAWWAIHAGGTEVLRQVGKRLDIGEDKLKPSISIFKRYGNMSSPTVLFALKEIMERRDNGGLGLILAFGAGFTAFAALATLNPMGNSEAHPD